MGNSYWILVWAGWGIGLNMVSPMFLLRTACPYEGKDFPHGYDRCPTCGRPKGEEHWKYFVHDSAGAERNSWPDSTPSGMTDHEVDLKHSLTETYGEFWKVLRIGKE